MADLQTSYMGLPLTSPILVGSSGLTYSVDSIQKLEEAGAGGVVLKSVFEEQILIESDPAGNEISFHTEGVDYFNAYTKEHHLNHYLELIEGAKKAVSIPIIASINCMSISEWITFAKRLENAGADGLELNYFLLPSDPRMADLHVEQTLFEMVRRVLREVKIPVSVKLSPYFSNFANTLQGLDLLGVKGVTLFNRFYQPDIDIDKMALVEGQPYSSPDEASLTLRWMAIASGIVECDLAASRGVHNGEGVIKQLLAGATAVQMVSTIYKNKMGAISVANKFIAEWMDKKGFKSIEDFRGKLTQSASDDPTFFERVQFLKHFGRM